MRAIACLSVVFFHAFPKFLPGGFIGVDIFFVISGFLITGILLKGLYKSDGSGRVDLIDFYIRRIRRIFPVLICVLIACLVVGFVVLSPEELSALGKHVAGGAGYVSNFVLWSEAGYFDKDAISKPLLHLWSLGIEEQFYIVWPFLLWAIYKCRLNMLWSVIAFTVASFAIDIATMTSDPTANFYAPWSRFWELSVGGGLAWYLNHDARSKAISNNRMLCHVLSVTGILLLCFGFAVIQNGAGFPGYLAVIPVVGAVCIIAAGKNAVVNKYVLSTRPFVWFGLISYPLYLWHWPILSYCYFLRGGIGTKVGACAVVLAIFLSWFTYRFIEPPLRYGSYKSQKALGLLATLIAFGGIGLGMFKHYGDTAKLDGYEFMREQKVVDTQRCQKVFPIWPESGDDNQCAMRNDLGKNAIALIGDSHSNSLYSGLAHEFASIGVEVFPASCAAPLVDVKTGWKSSTRVLTTERIGIAYDHIAKDGNVKVVVMTHNPWCSLGDGATDLRNPGLTDEMVVLRNGLERTFELLKDKQVVFVLDNPISPINPTRCTSNLKKFIVGEGLCRFPVSVHNNNDRRNRFNELVVEVSKKYSNVAIADLTVPFCDSESCYLERNGAILYFDTGHLTAAGSVVAAEYLAPFVRDALKKAAKK